MVTPILDREPEASLRDPAAFFHDGIFYCFHTSVEQKNGEYRLFIDVAQSRDLVSWSFPQRMTQSDLNFSSPGNVIRFEDHWVLCLQSYPIKAGEAYGSDDSRLWIMTSRDLTHWEQPRLLQPSGCQAIWCKSRRQIDPYLVEHEEQFWCFYKSAGNLGLLVSPDLREWREASPHRPVLAAGQTPDGSTVENPCVVRDEDEFVLFFAPCRIGRGIGTARSNDLLNWRDVRYLDFPDFPWASGGPTAPMVLDTRRELGCWTMFFHGDRQGPHGAAIGLAWSSDLIHWHGSR